MIVAIVEMTEEDREVQEETVAQDHLGMTVATVTIAETIARPTAEIIAITIAETTTDVTPQLTGRSATRDAAAVAVPNAEMTTTRALTRITPNPNRTTMSTDKNEMVSL